MPPNAPTTLPREILERVERISAYHRDSRYSRELAQQEAKQPLVGSPPGPFRVFDAYPKVALPTALFDLPTPTLSLLDGGLAALPESQVSPPQDLKTLATWLHMADGIISKLQVGATTYWIRSCPSRGLLYPWEIYVAAFWIDGLEPGLYHYSVREFALRKLRNGPETLFQLKRGRPDLEFLKTVPAALLVSSVFARSSWRYGRRAYRHAVRDAGHVIQNLTTVATGLGLETLTRLRMNDSTTRELIGVSPDADYGTTEAVQGMVVWIDRATCPLPGAAPPAHEPAAQSMDSIPRAALADQIKSFGSILATHADCVAPGVAVREIRPPLTELSPMPANIDTLDAPKLSEPPPGLHLRQVLMTRPPPAQFDRRNIPRDLFLYLIRLAFRGGTYFPLHPDGPHVALVRPFFITHGITGLDAGIWYYHPPTDKWSLLGRGDYRRESAHLAGEQPAVADSSALCIMTANLHTLLTQGGPDLYRLAHLEAGIAAQRLLLACQGLQLAAVPLADIYDEETCKFLGLERSHWEPIYAVAIGHVAQQQKTPQAQGGLHLKSEDADWRG